MNSNDCKTGMRVRCIDGTMSPLKEGAIYTISEVDFGGYVELEELPENGGWSAVRFEPVKSKVYQPTHYTQRGGIESIDFIKSNNLSFLEGCVVKYIYRYPFKNGVEDLKKARFYLDALIQEQEDQDE